jgi:prephenate dehydratase
VPSREMSTAPEGPSPRPRVGYLGPEGTFSEEALLASAAPDAVDPVALATIEDAVRALPRGEVDWAIVPIENSIEGSVSITLDLLAREAGSVQIAGEALLRVRHALIAARPMALEEIETVITHPQVPGQCSAFLHDELPGARVLPCTSTAEAVRSVAVEQRPGQAALGTALAARIYGASVLRDGVEDRDDNETRFIWLARAGDDSEPPLRDVGGNGSWKTSLLFWGQGAGRPGWLVRCLDEFARREIDLTKIESRPRPGRMGSYMFFADLAGSVREPRVAESIEGVQRLCDEARVLGSYRAASPAGHPAVAG